MSSSSIQRNPITLQATAAEIPVYSVVKMGATGMSVATATTGENLLGTVIRPVGTSKAGAVDLFQEAGTCYVNLNTTVTKGDLLRAAEGGKVSVGSGSTIVGIANENGASGDVIEMIKGLRADANA